MGVKTSYISCQNEITYYSLNVCDLVKVIVQRYSSFGEFYGFICLRTDLFYIFGVV